MKGVHFSILFTWIKEYYEIFHCLSITDRFFTQPRIFDSSCENPQRYFIYLTNDSSLLGQEWCDAFPDLIIMQTTNAPDQEILPSSWREHLVFLYSPNTLWEVYNQILDLFTRYYCWYDQCMKLILEDAPLSELLDHATMYLDNPVAFFDPAGIVLHQTGFFRQDIQGTLWDEVVSSHFTPVESISPNEHNRIMHEIKQGKKIIYSIFHQDPSHQALTIPIQVNGKHAGALGTTDINTSFTDMQKNFLLIISSIVQIAIRRQIQASVLQEEENYYVIRLLQGFSADQQATNQYLNKLGMKNEDTWYLYLFPLVDSSCAQTRKAAYLNKIKQALSNSVVLLYENSVIGICRKKNFDPKDPACLLKLRDTLHHLSMNVFISYHFLRFTELSIAYEQCLLMQQYSSHPASSIQQFPESFQQILYSILKERTSLKGFCHPAILALWKSSSEYQRTLVYDLKYYLLHGRNIAETSRYLNLYRNTFIYRLKKIEEYLQISLDSLDENMLLYLLFSCLICEKNDHDILLV